MKQNIIFFLRSYSKGLFRTPQAVLSLKEAAFIKSNMKDTKCINKMENKKENKFYIPNTNFNYEIVSQEDIRVGPSISMSKVSNEKYIFLEGSRLITEAINANIKLKTIFFVELKILNQIPLLKIKNNVNFLKIKEKQIKIWSEMDTPPGIMAISTLPKNLTTNKNAVPITVIITDMMNENILGSIVRSFVSANVLKILYIRDRCNVWNWKTLRSGAGSHFYIPIQPVMWEEILTLVSNTPNIYAYNLVDEIDLNDDNGEKIKSNRLSTVDGNDSTNNFEDYLTLNKSLDKKTEFNVMLENDNGNSKIKIHDESRSNIKDNILDSFQEDNFREDNNDLNKNSIMQSHQKVIKSDKELNTFTDYNGKELSGIQISSVNEIENNFIDISELKYEAGNVCLIVGGDINKKMKSIQVQNRIKYIGLREKLLPVTSISILIFQLCRLIKENIKVI